MCMHPKVGFIKFAYGIVLSAMWVIMRVSQIHEINERSDRRDNTMRIFFMMGSIFHEIMILGFLIQIN